MKRIFLLVALAAVALATSLVSISPASAANASCGAGYVRVRAVAFPNGEINLWRNGDNWCAYTRRTGSYYGAAGYTRTILWGYSSAWAGSNYSRVADGSRILYYSGPIKFYANCAQAYGATGNTTGYKGSAYTGRYC